MSNLSKYPVTLQPAAKVQNWTRILLSTILIFSFTPGESANSKSKKELKQSQIRKNTQKQKQSKALVRKRNRKALRKFTLKDAGNNYEVELRRLVSNINKIRTKAGYIEAMAPGLPAKERAEIRQRLQSMQSIPRAHYRGNQSFLLVSGKKKFLIRLKDFSKAKFTINGVPWTYNPKRSYIQQLDAFAKVMSKTQKSASNFPFSALVPEAQAELVTGTVIVAGVVVLAAGTKAVQVYRKYKKYQRFYRAENAAAEAAATAAGRASSRGSRGRARAQDRAARASGQLTREERKAAEQAAADLREREAFLKKRRMEISVEKQIASENHRNLKFFGGAVLGGLSAGAGYVGSQSVFNAFVLARERETVWYRELLCPYLPEGDTACKKMQVEIEPAVKTEGPSQGSRVILPCPSNLLPEYFSIKDVTLKTEDGKVEFQGKKINIIKVLENGLTVIEEHFAIPSKMDESIDTSDASSQNRTSGIGGPLRTQTVPSPKSRFDEMIERQSGPSTPVPDEEKKPIYLVQTKSSRLYEFGPKGALTRIRKLGFNKPTLPMTSTATSFPFIPTLVPNYDVPENQQEAYFKSRKEWLENARDKSTSANEPINDPVESQKNSVLREDWEGAIAEMDILKDSFNKECGKKGADSTVKTIDVEVGDVNQSTEQ